MSNNLFRQFNNVVGETHLRLIQEALSSQYFGWYFHPDINHGVNFDEPTNLGFVHTLIREGNNQSEFAPLFAPLAWTAIDKTNEQLACLLRVKSNLTLNMGKKENSKPHQDLELGVDPNWNLWSAIFYPFDVDGDTVFYSDKTGSTELGRITPKANTMVLFNSLTFHHGCLPTIATHRKIVNIAFATTSQL